MTDFRALCKQLADELEAWLGYDKQPSSLPREYQASLDLVSKAYRLLQSQQDQKQSTLKSLEEHNKRTLEQFWPGTYAPRPNGLACPDCGAELMDSNPSNLLLTNPPQYNVNCSVCKFTGTRY